MGEGWLSSLQQQAGLAELLIALTAFSWYSTLCASPIAGSFDGGKNADVQTSNGYTKVLTAEFLKELVGT